MVIEMFGICRYEWDSNFNINNLIQSLQSFNEDEIRVLDGNYLDELGKSTYIA